MKKTLLYLVLFLIMTGKSFASKTVFVEVPPPNENDSTVVTDDIMNALNNAVPTGEDRDGSLPLLYNTDIGSAANWYKISLTYGPVAYVAGQQYSLKSISTNTGASYFRVGSLANVSIKKLGSLDLTAGDIATGQIVNLEYDGTYFQMINPYQPDIFLANSEIASSRLGSYPTTWTEWNVSANIPTGYRYAIVSIEMQQNGPDSSNNSQIWMRPNDDSSNGNLVAACRASAGSDATGNATQVWVPVGTNRILEYKFIRVPTSPIVVFRLQGYAR